MTKKGTFKNGPVRLFSKETITQSTPWQKYVNEIVQKGMDIYDRREAGDDQHQTHTPE